MKEGWSWCPAAFSLSVFVAVPSDLHLFTGERRSTPTLAQSSLRCVHVPPFRPSPAASFCRWALFVARLVGFHLQELTSALPTPPPSLIPSSSHLCHDYTFASLTCDDVTTFFWQQTLPLPSNCLLSEKPSISLSGSRSSRLVHLFLFKVLIFLPSPPPMHFPPNSQ